MMETELRQLLKEHGWNLFKRRIRERDYWYAQKWKKGEVYISSQTNLPHVTPDKVLEKIANVQ